MQGKQTEMHHVRNILRLKAQGASDKLTARCVGLARSTVQATIKRAAAAGLEWPLDETLSDEALAALLFIQPSKGAMRGVRRKPEPDWAAIHQDLKRPHMTKALVWQEYHEANPDGYGYSRFCDLLGAFAEKLTPTMRQTHKAGEKMFVDFAGATIPIVIDARTGQTHQAQIFVACLGASSFTYVEATWGQTAADWVCAQANALAAFGGVPQIIVPDNPKSAIAKACFYEPSLHRTYADFAAHHDLAVIPARVRKPRDKAKVESGVQVAQRWIVARLRNHCFKSLAELNAAIAPLVEALNRRTMRRLNTSRAALFEAVEKPALKPLPREPYVYAEWKIRRVGLDYHIDVEKHFYSVPYRYLREEVDVRVAARTVEIFLKGERIAAHLRQATCGKHTTQPDHMPESHRAYAGWTITKIKADAEKIGPLTARMVEHIFERKHHPEQGVRAGLGILRLAKDYGPDRLEVACARGLDHGACSYGSIRSILANNLDRATTPEPAPPSPLGNHENVRGPAYYN
jgi:transposase